MKHKNKKGEKMNSDKNLEQEIKDAETKIGKNRVHALMTNMIISAKQYDINQIIDKTKSENRELTEAEYRLINKLDREINTMEEEKSSLYNNPDPRCLFPFNSEKVCKEYRDFIDNIYSKEQLSRFCSQCKYWFPNTEEQIDLLWHNVVNVFINPDLLKRIVASLEQQKINVRNNIDIIKDKYINKMSWGQVSRKHKINHQKLKVLIKSTLQYIKDEWDSYLRGEINLIDRREK